MPDSISQFFRSFDDAFNGFFLKCLPFLVLSLSKELPSERVVFYHGIINSFGSNAIDALLEPQDEFYGKYKPFAVMFLDFHNSLLELGLTDDAQDLKDKTFPLLTKDIIPKAETKGSITVLKRSLANRDDKLASLIETIKSHFDGQLVAVPDNMHFITPFIREDKVMMDTLKGGYAYHKEQLKKDPTSPSSFRSLVKLFADTRDTRCLCRCLKNIRLVCDDSNNNNNNDDDGDVNKNWILQEAEKLALSDPKVAYNLFCYRLVRGENIINNLKELIEKLSKANHQYHVLLYMFSNVPAITQVIWDAAVDCIPVSVWKPLIPFMFHKMNKAFRTIISKFCESSRDGNGNGVIIQDIAWYSVEKPELFKEFQGFHPELFKEVQFLYNHLRNISVLWDEIWLNQCEYWYNWYYKNIVSDAKLTVLKLRLFLKSITLFKTEYWSPFDRDLSPFEQQFKKEFSELLSAGETNVMKAIAKNGEYSTRTLREIYHPFRRVSILFTQGESLSLYNL